MQEAFLQEVHLVGLVGAGNGEEEDIQCDTWMFEMRWTANIQEHRLKRLYKATVTTHSIALATNRYQGHVTNETSIEHY